MHLGCHREGYHRPERMVGHCTLYCHRLWGKGQPAVSGARVRRKEGGGMCKIIIGTQTATRQYQLARLSDADAPARHGMHARFCSQNAHRPSKLYDPTCQPNQLTPCSTAGLPLLASTSLPPGSMRSGGGTCSRPCPGLSCLHLMYTCMHTQTHSVDSMCVAWICPVASHVQAAEHTAKI
jgi:hypothetical protein